MRHDPVGTIGRPEPEALRRRRRVLLVFGLASLAAHAAAIVALPDFFHAAGPVPVSVLEVTVLKPEPLPVSAVPPEAIPRQHHAERKSRNTHAPVKAEREQAAPVLTVSRPEPVPEGSFAVAPASVPGQQPAPASKSQMASAALTPPSFNAAYLSNPAPRYPLSSRRAGEQGTVTLRVLVRRDGLPAQIEIEKSSGSSHLDAAALEAVKGWRFVPARQGADPVESWVLVPVVFRLEGSS